MFKYFLIFWLIFSLIRLLNSKFFKKNRPNQEFKIDESLRPRKLTPGEEKAFYKTEAGKQFNKIFESLKSKNKK